jgi:hypothetical protein
MLDRLRIYQFCKITADYFCFKNIKIKNPGPEGLGRKNFKIETQLILPLQDVIVYGSTNANLSKYEIAGYSGVFFFFRFFCSSSLSS